MLQTSAAVPVRRRGISYAKYGYIFCLPFIMAFAIFSLYPIIYTASISFSDLKGMGTANYNYLPDLFGNYKSLLGNNVFRTSLQTTLILWVFNFIPQIGLALILTAWFTNTNLKVRAQGAFKILLFLPNIITAGTIAVLFYSFFGYPIGPVNTLLQQLKIIDAPVEFLRSPAVSRGLISFIQFWMWYGNTMIVLVAGVMGINPALFEAAAIDGADNVQTFFKITLPCLRTILLYTLVTSMIGGLQMFDIPKLFNDGKPNNMTQTVSVYIFKQAFTGSFQYNRAAAASMIMFVIISVLAAILFYIMRDRDEALANKARKLEKKAAKGGAVK